MATTTTTTQQIVVGAECPFCGELFNVTRTVTSPIDIRDAIFLVCDACLDAQAPMTSLQEYLQ